MKNIFNKSAELKYLIAIFILFILTVPLNLMAEDAEGYLNKIEKEYSGVKSIEAKCVQTFYNRTMGKTFTFKGTVFIRRPDKFRWEITDPDEQLIIIDGENLWIYTKENNQVIKESADKKGRAKLALLLLADINELKKNFTITVANDGSETLELGLMPNEATADVKSARLIVNKSNYRIAGIKITDAYDNHSVYSFEETVFNSNIPDSRFVYVPPDGVEVVDSSSI